MPSIGLMGVTPSPSRILVVSTIRLSRRNDRRIGAKVFSASSRETVGGGGRLAWRAISFVNQVDER